MSDKYRVIDLTQPGALDELSCTVEDIIVLSETTISQNDINTLIAPLESGKVKAVFGVGTGRTGLWDRLLCIGSAVLTRIRLSSMTHAGYALKKEVLKGIHLTEKGAGFSAELAAKLSDHKVSATEVRLSAPHKAFANMLHAMISILIHSPLVTYGMVGLISTLVEWALFWLLDNLTCSSVELSTTIAFTLSTVVNWYLGRAWTFKAHAGSFSDILPVCLVSALGLGLSIGIMDIFTKLLDWPNFLSKVITTMLVFFWNYLARKKLVYRHNKH